MACYDSALDDVAVVGCLGTLGMGENLAVEVAQHVSGSWYLSGGFSPMAS